MRNTLEDFSVAVCGGTRSACCVLAEHEHSVARVRSVSLVGLHEAVAYRVAHEPSDVVDLEPVHEQRPMRLDRFDAHAEDARDLFRGLALGDELQRLALPRRENRAELA